MSDLLNTLRGLTEIVEKHSQEPFGPPASPELRKLAGDACVRLCNGNQDEARTLYKLILADSTGYMPSCAARALVRASHVKNLVPDIEAPVPS